MIIVSTLCRASCVVNTFPLTLTSNNYANYAVFLLLLLSFRIRAQQDNAPVVWISDKRVEVYGFKNARVVVDYQTTLDNKHKQLYRRFESKYENHKQSK